jgi:hypothetical protein
MIFMPTGPTSAVRATPRPTKFSLAANYDPELIPAFDAYPVDEVYGKFPGDGVSGGRPRYMATPLPAGSIGGTGHDHAVGLDPIGPPRNSA